MNPKSEILAIDKLMGRLKKRREKLSQKILASMKKSKQKKSEHKAGSISRVQPELTILNDKYIYALMRDEGVLQRAKKAGIAASVEELEEYLYVRSIKRSNFEALLQHKVVTAAQGKKAIEVRKGTEHIRVSLKQK